MAQSSQSSASQATRYYPGGALDVASEYFALKDLNQTLGPAGCWRVRNALRAAGISLSEATAGRLLRQFDQRGYTMPVGSKGRLLTDKGRRRLVELEQARARDSVQEDLWRAIHVERVEDILEVLVARRVIEAEAASLAALNASDEELAELERAVQAHIVETRAGRNAAELNRAIHRLILQAAHSKVLQAVANLILQDVRLLKTQARIQQAAGMGALAPEEHTVILAAIKARQPEQAAAAMRAHLERIIRVMQVYHAGQGAISALAQAGSAEAVG
ncbi:MAG: FadR/GntR family transcriptional regulator [Chloroflexota bacterium]